MVKRKKLNKKILKPADLIDQMANHIEEVKNKSSIIEVFKHYGVNLKGGTGGEYTGLCCFHDDTHPSLSVNADKKVYKCHGCGKSGNIFHLVQEKEGLDFGEALKWLERFTGEIIQPEQTLFEEKKEELPEIKEKPDKQLLFQEAMKIYRLDLEVSREPVLSLEKRGLKSKNKHSFFHIGYCNGKSFTNRLSEDDKNYLIQVGLLNKHGNEFFTRCLVFPIYDELDNIVSFYGRSIDPDSKYPHLYLAGKHRSIFNRRASKIYPDHIILTECIIDTVSLAEIGFDNVQACYGVNGYTDEMLAIHKTDGVSDIVIAFDNDTAGKKASENLKDKLVNEDFQIRCIFPPGFKDWNEELVNGITKEEVQKLIDNAEIFKKEETNTVKMEKITGGYSFLFPDGEKYEVLNFKEDYVGPLKVILKVEAYGKMHCDDFNLYTYRSRENFTKQAEYLTGLPVDKGTEQILSIIKNLEEARNRKLNTVKEEEKEPELTEAEIKIGIDFLTNPNLFDELREDLTLIGCVGEENTKVLLYLVATSRQRVNPISVYVLGRSSGGKSWLVKTILKLIPDNAK
ncbi:MAG: toprim domain-containing protein, partial [Actinomycetia bacterium]|nr:toprim domain-containing protein [Actinomycetes bacterium]